MKTVDVMIPTYKPGKEFETVIKRLCLQTFPVSHIYITNTEEEYWDKKLEEKYPVLKVSHIRKEEFDHGKTRKKMAELSDADIIIFMTQDAVPADRNLVSELISSIGQDKIAASYARQLAKKDCNIIESYTRIFNYPGEKQRKSKEDIKKLGIKTYFCSNVCAAYDRKIYESLGGFVDKTIFNEDMIFAWKLIQAGYQISYEAAAKVYHSHNYSGIQQFCRNFDLGVSQKEYQEVFSGVPSEGEGIRMVLKLISYLINQKKPWLIPNVIYQSGCKYAGYFLGKNYEKLPGKCVYMFSMNKKYWE